MFSRRKFNERIHFEYENFKEFVLDLYPEEVYGLSFEISFKKAMFQNLIDHDLVGDELAELLDTLEGDILGFLFHIYNDEFGIFTMDGVVEECLDEFLLIDLDDIEY